MQQPDDDTLTRCLIEMLTFPDQRPIYLIIDALDECSDISGIPTSRNRVLQLVKKLVDLQDQSGQKKDIEDYIRSVVYSDLEPIMRRWRKEDKELVIKVLSDHADGM